MVRIKKANSLLTGGLFLLAGITASIKVQAQQQELQGRYFNTQWRLKGSKQLYIHASEGGSYLFYLEVSIRNPIYFSYDGLGLYGRLTLNKTTGHLEYLPKDTLAGCRLEMAKEGDNMVVKTLAGNSGFIKGLLADDTYVLRDKLNPSYFKTTDGRMVYFSRTTPESVSNETSLRH